MCPLLIFIFLTFISHISLCYFFIYFNSFHFLYGFFFLSCILIFFRQHRIFFLSLTHIFLPIFFLSYLRLISFPLRIIFSSPFSNFSPSALSRFYFSILSLLSFPVLISFLFFFFLFQLHLSFFPSSPHFLCDTFLISSLFGCPAISPPISHSFTQVIVSLSNHSPVFSCFIPLYSPVFILIFSYPFISLLRFHFSPVLPFSQVSPHFQH